jgi:hypothetical protein
VPLVALFLIPRVAARAVTLADFIGETYFDRHVLTATATFRSCAFRGRSKTGTSWPDDFGGAVYVNSNAVGLGLPGSLLEDCWARNNGGAVCAN